MIQHLQLTSGKNSHRFYLKEPYYDLTTTELSSRILYSLTAIEPNISILSRQNVETSKRRNVNRGPHLLSASWPRTPQYDTIRKCGKWWYAVVLSFCYYIQNHPESPHSKPHKVISNSLHWVFDAQVLRVTLRCSRPSDHPKLILWNRETMGNQWDP